MKKNDSGRIYEGKIEKKNLFQPRKNVLRERMDSKNSSFYDSSSFSDDSTYSTISSNISTKNKKIPNEYRMGFNSTDPMTNSDTKGRNLNQNQNLNHTNNVSFKSPDKSPQKNNVVEETTIIEKKTKKEKSNMIIPICVILGTLFAVVVVAIIIGIIQSKLYKRQQKNMIISSAIVDNPQNLQNSSQQEIREHIFNVYEKENEYENIKSIDIAERLNSPDFNKDQPIYIVSNQKIKQLDENVKSGLQTAKYLENQYKNNVNDSSKPERYRSDESIIDMVKNSKRDNFSKNDLLKFKKIISEENNLEKMNFFLNHETGNDNLGEYEEDTEDDESYSEEEDDDDEDDDDEFVDDTSEADSHNHSDDLNNNYFLNIDPVSLPIPSQNQIQNRFNAFNDLANTE